MGISNKDIIEEEEKEKKYKADRQMRNRHEKFRAKRKEKLNIEIKENEFMIKSININNKFRIDHANEMCQYADTCKTFAKTFLITETAIYESIEKYNTFGNIQVCNNINEHKILANNDEYLKNKIKVYLIDNSNREQIICNKKIKYNESELNISNEISIFIELEKKKKKIDDDNIVENGIPVDDLKIRKRRMLENAANNAEKVTLIIEDIKKESITKKIFEEKNIPIYYYFCINCYQCYNSKETEEINEHLEHFVIKVNDFIEVNKEIDYNERLNILYKILIKEQNKIIKNGNNNLINYYRQLLLNLYEIIINNDSSEELNTSIIAIYEDYLKEDELGTFTNDIKDYFLFFSQKICELANLKVKEISVNEDDTGEGAGLVEDNTSDFKEFDDLDDLNEFDSENNGENINNNNNNNSFEKCNSDEDKKKYFFKLGFKLSNKNKNNISINELYSKAKEESIEPNDYENFLIKEFNMK
jgi:hypothetical protein